VNISDQVLESPALKERVYIREMPAEDWIDEKGSGTLRKNKRIGFAWKSQYLHERVAYEFGFAFEVMPKTQVTFNDPITEGDCKPLTEAGWHIERYMSLSVFPEDRFETKYIQVEDRDGSRREGVGIVVKQTSAPWIPKGHLVFAIVTEHSKTLKTFREAKNPF
jgi:hypothetical protein